MLIHKAAKFLALNYLGGIFLFHKNILRKLLYHLIQYYPNFFPCFLINVFQFLQRKKVRFFFDKNKNLFYAREFNLKHYFYSKIRGFSFFSNGIMNRSVILSESYFIHLINLRKNDVIFDCGANYGDLFPYFSQFVEPQNYHSFDPSPKDFACLILNAARGKNNELGLYDKSTTIPFYVNLDYGDSSILKPAQGFDQQIKIKTISLKQYCLNNSIKFITLLKLEAEGLEPEILLGAEEYISIIKYVAVDGGPERGIFKEETLSKTTNFLLANNFELLCVDISSKIGRALFRNKSFMNTNSIMK